MSQESKQCVLFTLLIALCISFSFPVGVNAQSFSSPTADLVGNERAVYSLPDVGSILPDNPLFVFKQLRDDVTLALPQDKFVKLKHLIQLGDRYTVYADKMVRTSKLKRAISLFESSLKFQNEALGILQDLSDDTQKNENAISDLKGVFMQSNIKQAEIIRTLIGEVSSSEQSTFIQLLDKNVILRKKLQEI